MMENKQVQFDKYDILGSNNGTNPRRQQMETYEIYLNGSLADTSNLAGLAYLKYESARLLGDASIVRISHNPDPVLGGRWIYDHTNGGWV
jgi:hypothetical protein